MNILVITGSAHKKGTSSYLADVFIKGAEEAGHAVSRFDAAFKNDKTQMDNFYNLIEQYCVALENIAAKYDLAESQNVSTASTRTY